MKTQFITATIQNQEITMKALMYDDHTQCDELLKWYEKFQQLNECTKQIGSTRKLNLAEAFTEGIYCLLTNSCRVIQICNSKISSSFDCYNFDLKKTVQVKATQIANDCTSFGPKTKFDLLVFVDLYDVSQLKIYYVPPELVYNWIVNKKKNETVSDQQKQGKRPRLSLKKVISFNKIQPVFVGDLLMLRENFKSLVVDTKKSSNLEIQNE